jgi:peptide/nickel transport system permease protein
LIAVETVFSWPGVGRDMVLALTEKDYPVAQGCFLVICAMVSVLNLLADILYGFIDPRITYARSKAVAET